MTIASWFVLGGHVSLGEVLVFVGAIAAAFYTRRLAAATYELDRRTAARERKRRERQIRGVARLVHGELEFSTESIERAVETAEWTVTFPTPHGAWDREGTAIAETVAEDAAQSVIRFFSRLESWEALVRFFRQHKPVASGFSLTEGQLEMLAMLLALAEDARRELRPIAYPDARNLEPDPDGLIAYSERTKRRWFPRRQ